MIICRNILLSNFAELCFGLNNFGKYVCLIPPSSNTCQENMFKSFSWLESHGSSYFVGDVNNGCNQIDKNSRPVDPCAAFNQSAMPGNMPSSSVPTNLVSYKLPFIHLYLFGIFFCLFNN
jgi:hypothetical protein